MSVSLLLFVALATLPAVLLLAFAGCEDFGAEEAQPGTGPHTETDEERQARLERERLEREQLARERLERERLELERLERERRERYATTILAEPGLISYWRLRETAAGQALDSAPAPINSGTYTGRVVFQRDGTGALAPNRDDADTAPLFNGRDAYVEMAPDGTVDSSFTIEAWIKPARTSGAGTYHDIFSALDVLPGDIYSGFTLGLVYPGDPTFTPGIFVFVGGGRPGSNGLAIVPFPDGPGDAWRHVVATYDGGTPKTLRLSVSPHDDEALVTTKTEVGYQANLRQRMRIGAGRLPNLDASGPARFFEGAIDEVALYNVALLHEPPEKDRIKAHFDIATTAGP